MPAVKNHRAMLPDPKRLPSIVGDRKLGEYIGKGHGPVVRAAISGQIPFVRIGKVRVYSNLTIRRHFGWPEAGALAFSPDKPAW